MHKPEHPSENQSKPPPSLSLWKEFGAVCWEYRYWFFLPLFLLIFTTVVFLMEGENLDPLVELLNDEEVKSLHRFNPKLHEAPAEGETILTSIRLVTRSVSGLWTPRVVMQ